METKNRNKNYDNLICHICSRSFSFKESIDNHLMDTHLCCPQCNIIETNKKKLTKHRAFAHYILNCPICKNFSLNTEKLKFHIHNTHDIKFYCVKCNLVFKNKIDHIKHQELIHRPPHKRPYLDLHDLFLKEVCWHIHNHFSKNPKIDKFKIVHGYSHGTTLQKFIRSEKFIELFAKRDFQIEIIDQTHKVYTIIKIKRVTYHVRNGK